MAFDFPNSPAIGQAAHGYNWDGNAWVGGGQYIDPKSLNAFATVDSSYISDLLVDIPDMSVNVKNGRTYGFEVVLFIASDTAQGGVKAAIAGSCIPTSIIYNSVVFDADTVKGTMRAEALATPVAAVPLTGTLPTIHINGTISVQGLGTLTVQFAQHTSTAAPTFVKAGSYITVRELL